MLDIMKRGIIPIAGGILAIIALFMGWYVLAVLAALVLALGIYDWMQRALDDHPQLPGRRTHQVAILSASSLFAGLYRRR